MSQPAVDVALEYNEVASRLKDDIYTGNVRDVLSLGAVYDLEPYNRDGQLLAFALETPNLHEVQNVILSYLIQIHHWHPTAAQIIASIREDMAHQKHMSDKSIYLLIGALDNESTVIDVFLTLYLRKEFDRSLAKLIVGYHALVGHFHSAEYKSAIRPLSTILAELPPFPQQKEAVKFAKEYGNEKAVHSFYVSFPTFRNSYRYALNTFGIEDLLYPDTKRITLSAPLQSSRDRIDMQFEELDKSVHRNVMETLSQAKLQALRNKVLEAGPYLNLDAVFLSNLLALPSKDLAPELKKMFDLRGAALPCRNRDDLEIFSQDAIVNVPTIFVHTHDALCFEIKALWDWVVKNDSNPITRRAFTLIEKEQLRIHMTYLLQINKIISA